jgi:DNA-binding response OmpR family regulator
LIYVLEDDNSQLRLVCEYLESLYYTVRGFSDGEHLLSVLRRTTPDILISDYTLRVGMSGEECAREVRRLAPGVQIIILSGQPRPDVTIADHWIQKGSSAMSSLRRVLDLL